MSGSIKLFTMNNRFNTISSSKNSILSLAFKHPYIKLLLVAKQAKNTGSQLLLLCTDKALCSEQLGQKQTQRIPLSFFQSDTQLIIFCSHKFGRALTCLMVIDAKPQSLLQMAGRRIKISVCSVSKHSATDWDFLDPKHVLLNWV